MQSKALLILLGAVGLSWAFASAPVSAQSWVATHSGVERWAARLETSTSPAERARLAERLGRLGPFERTVPILSQALAAEMDPEVRLALLSAITRVAVLAPEAARALEPALLERYAQASPSERPPLARALGALATPGAFEALILRLPESSALDALVAGHATEALLAALLAEPTTGSATQLHILEALERIGDPAAVAPLLALLGTPELEAIVAHALASVGASAGEEVRTSVRRQLLVRLSTSEDALSLVALLEALAAIPPGAPEDVAPIRARLADLDTSVARAALRALGRSDEAGALSSMREAAGDPARREAVLSLLRIGDAPAWVPLAAELAEEEPLREEALDFLARVRGGEGIEALAQLGASPFAIALSVRRQRGTEHGEAALRRAGILLGSSRMARALAGEAVELTPLASADPEARLEVAIALGLTPAAPDAERLRAALEGEADARVQAWLLEAARRHHVALDARWLRRALSRAPSEALAPLLLVIPEVIGDPATAPPDRRALRRVLSTSLRAERPDLRASAAVALASLGASEASAAIEALLEDPQPAVRIAASVALSRLDPSRRVFIAARARIDPDPRVVRVLTHLEALPSSDVLLVSTVAHGPVGERHMWLEVQTDDGLVRTLPVATSGAFALPDVPGPFAEVSLRLR